MQARLVSVSKVGLRSLIHSLSMSTGFCGELPGVVRCGGACGCTRTTSVMGSGCAVGGGEVACGVGCGVSCGVGGGGLNLVQCRVVAGGGYGYHVCSARL